MLQCTMGEPILDSISVDFSLGLLEKDATLWAGDNGPWMSRIGLPSREVHYSPPIMNSSRCWPGCATLGAEMSCWCVALAAHAELGFQALSSPLARAASPWQLAGQWILQWCLPSRRVYPRNLFCKSSGWHKQTLICQLLELCWALTPPLLSHLHLLIPAFPIPLF